MESLKAAAGVHASTQILARSLERSDASKVLSSVRTLRRSRELDGAAWVQTLSALMTLIHRFPASLLDHLVRDESADPGSWEEAILCQLSGAPFRSELADGPLRKKLKVATVFEPVCSPATPTSEGNAEKASPAAAEPPPETCSQAFEFSQPAAVPEHENSGFLEMSQAATIHGTESTQCSEFSQVTADALAALASELRQLGAHATALPALFDQMTADGTELTQLTQWLLRLELHACTDAVRCLLSAHPWASKLSLQHAHVFAQTVLLPPAAELRHPASRLLNKACALFCAAHPGVCVEALLIPVLGEGKYQSDLVVKLLRESLAPPEVLQLLRRVLLLPNRWTESHCLIMSAALAVKPVLPLEQDDLRMFVVGFEAALESLARSAKFGALLLTFVTLFGTRLGPQLGPELGRVLHLCGSGTAKAAHSKLKGYLS